MLKKVDKIFKADFVLDEDNVHRINPETFYNDTFLSRKILKITTIRWSFIYMYVVLRQ